MEKLFGCCFSYLSINWHRTAAQNAGCRICVMNSNIKIKWELIKVQKVDLWHVWQKYTPAVESQISKYFDILQLIPCWNISHVQHSYSSTLRSMFEASSCSLLTSWPLLSRSWAVSGEILFQSEDKATCLQEENPQPEVEVLLLGLAERLVVVLGSPARYFSRHITTVTPVNLLQQWGLSSTCSECRSRKKCEVGWSGGTCGQNKRYEKDKLYDEYWPGVGGLGGLKGAGPGQRQLGRRAQRQVHCTHTGNVTIVSLYGLNSRGSIVLSASISDCSILMLFSPLYLRSVIQHSENILLSYKYKYRNGDTGERTGTCLGWGVRGTRAPDIFSLQQTHWSSCKCRR